MNDRTKDTAAPPSYDLAVSEASGSSGNNLRSHDEVPQYSASPYGKPTAPTVSRPPGPQTTPTVYFYTHPVTREQVTSLLPPDHPEMVCLQRGSHDPQTSFGFLGILAAVFWFPLGVGLCLLDRRIRCKTCGTMIDSGLCN
ncbi:hypothetical protein PLICRDRAFT_50984 [Plicaturopsis crispa FD-325 SS-3]|nr:hypothetical protein PLICRDRAFT_50984 [Plicaturopsis crispa FD-325 SS-3]